MNKFFDLVAAEMTKQDEKWGANRVHAPEWWLLCIMEELGEVAKAIHDKDPANLKEGVLQVAALIGQFFKDFDNQFDVKPIYSVSLEYRRLLIE